ncbi:MAG: hypothetical protein JHC84_17945 [Solirubrobacteraceae bacterium]|nr:hypothetical protein [Solirubrobacteraceae bacterium]
MPQDSRRALARAHIAAVVFGWGIEPARLTDVLIRGCWPGALDGARPIAGGVVKQWDVDGLQLQAPGCECAAGACLICN